MLSVGLSAAAPQPGQRIHANLNNHQSFVLEGNTRPAVLKEIARDQGRVSPSQPMPRMTLHFVMTPAQQSDLDQLLKDLQNRRSPHYHQFLTPEQFAERFGLPETDIAQVTTWLEEHGFSNIQASRSRTRLSFSGSVEQAESTFHVSLHRYSLAGDEYVANTANPSLPKSLQGVVQAIGGLHNFTFKPQIVRPRPNFTSSASGYHYLAPDDWATIYDVQPLYGAGYDGTGVTIAIVGQSDVLMTDIEAFRSAAGLQANDPKVIIPTGDQDPGFQSGDEVESDLDLEWAGGIARNASILFVTASAKTGNGVFDSLTYAIDNNVAPIVSISYSSCEADLSSADFQSFESLLKQAVAQGMTIVAASGDWGPAACDTAKGETQATHGFAVSYPASSEFVTAIGGTTFNEFGTGYWNSTNNSYNGSAVSYLPEMVWDDAGSFGTVFGASGGGASTLVPKPLWQAGPGVPADTARDLPDLAFAASPSIHGYLICSKGSCVSGFRNTDSSLEVAGGTSAGAPSFAGLLALVIQQKGAAALLGNINPNLYTLAQVSNNIFHDITVSANVVACAPASPNCPPAGIFGFIAGPGYDQATGWGSVDGYNFAEQWYVDFNLAATPASLTVQPGSSGTATVSVTPQNNFSGNVTFTCSVAAALADVTCSVPSAPVGPNGTVTVTITATNDASAPFWRRFHLGPPANNTLWLLLALLIPAALAVPQFSPKALRLRLSTQAGYVSMLALAASVVFFGVEISCGGSASSSTVSVGPTTPPAPQLSLNCLVPNAMVGSPTQIPCTASGGTPPFTFSITSGSLPAGLSLNAGSGLVSGTPTTPGTTSFTIAVTDSGSPAQVATSPEPAFVVKPKPIPLVLNSCSVALAEVSANFTGACPATGGTPPLVYSISAGPLPPGLTFNAPNGTLSGVPTASGFYFLTELVTDSTSPPQTASSSWLIDIHPFGPLSLPGFSFYARLGLPLQQEVFLNGGNPPYTFALNSGSLPPGISLNANGNLIGVPTAQGVSSFSVRVTDNSSPPQTAISPIGSIDVLPRLPESGLVTVTATSGGITNTATVNVYVP